MWLHVFNCFFLFSIAESVVAAYDTLVYCTTHSNNQPTFEFYISIPEAGSRNKLFAVTLKDSYTAVTYFVTTYSYSSSLLQNNTISLYTDESDGSQPEVTALAMAGCLMVLTVAFGVTYMFIEYRWKNIERPKYAKTKCNYKQDKRKCLITIYCISKFIYSIAFSFTVFLLLLNIVCSDDMDGMEGLSSYHLEIKKLVEKNIRSISEFKTIELDRQQNMKQERTQACNKYSRQSVLAIQQYLLNHTDQLVSMKKEIEDKRFSLLMEEIQQYILQTREHVDKVCVSLHYVEVNRTVSISLDVPYPITCFQSC